MQFSDFYVVLVILSVLAIKITLFYIYQSKKNK